MRTFRQKFQPASDRLRIQLRALGIRHTIWGATCYLGVVEVFSSEWDEDNIVRNMFSLVPLPFAFLQANDSSVFSSIPTQNDA
jgi:hypothetical protein